MEEVRSYWPVASIAHFCNLFGKPFKLPTFEPEELEQAFIMDVPEPPDPPEPQPPTSTLMNPIQQQASQLEQPQQQPNQVDEQQQNSHLLVKLGIALLKPHFTTKITPANWENYLRRIVDSNWVELEHHPSPFRVPIMTPEGVELTKNLTFNELSLSDKIDLFYALCDYRFWCEDASDAIADYAVEDLRLESIGKDSQGYEYWYFSGTRLFREDKELTQDLILRKKRIKELEYKIIELEKEARPAALKKGRAKANEKKISKILPQRTGLRERRSSAASNKNNEPPPPPKKSPIDDCKEELERIAIKPEDRAESWCLQCDSLEEWESFATRFEKTKSTNEKYLHSYINEIILPNIRAIYAKRQAEARRKEKELLLSLASRRVSTRIISKRAQEEEEERLAQQREIELQKKKAEAETRLRAELEREIRVKKNRLVINGGASSTCSDDGVVDDNAARYNLRQQQQQHHHYDPIDESNEFDGIIHPDKLSEFYEALELIIDTVKTSKYAWPFVDPVPDTEPGYYDLIEEPMDLKKLRTKVEFREYKSLIELEKDFQLLVNNCEKFNGPKNVYTKMVYKLWKTFRKNVRLYLQRDLHMDEYETLIYPPPAPVVQNNVINVHNGTSTTTISSPQQISANEYSPRHHQNENASNSVKLEHNPQNQMIQTNGVHNPSCDNGMNASESYEAVTAKSEMTSNTHQASGGEHTTSDVPMHLDSVKQVPPVESICEEVIVDSYAVDCPDENCFILPLDQLE